MIQIIATTKDNQKFGFTLQEPFSLQNLADGFQSLQLSMRDTLKEEDNITLRVLLGDSTFFELKNLTTRINYPNTICV